MQKLKDFVNKVDVNLRILVDSSMMIFFSLNMISLKSNSADSMPMTGFKKAIWILVTHYGKLKLVSDSSTKLK